MTYIQYLAARVLSLLGTAIFLAAIASWIPQVRNSKIGYYLNMVTEPIIAPFRKLLGMIPALRSMPVDFSPIAAMLALQLISRIILWL